MASAMIERQKNDLLRDITSLGSLFAYLLLISFFLIQKKYDVSTKLIIGLVVIYIATILIKSIYFKNRPEKIAYSSFIEKLDASSFPSLHTSRIIFLSAVLIKYYGNIYFSVLIVLLAIAIPYSRIYLRKHDIKDAIAGIVFGIAVYFVVNAFFQ